MALPLSFDRVLAALQRLSPSFPSTDADKDAGCELHAIAVPIGRAADRVDAAIDEIFPDTASDPSRWERLLRLPVRPTDAISQRRARLLSVLRRSSGPRLDQLRAMLAPVLDLAPEDLAFYEATRAQIEAALTLTTGAISAPLVSGAAAELGAYWPGAVDDPGVRIYIAVDAAGAYPFTLTAPDGTSWASATALATPAAWYQSPREVFRGKRAGGRWRLAIAPTGGVGHLTEFRIMVPNDVDARQIYYFAAYRDPSLGGAPDIAEATRLLRKTALAHMEARVIERRAFIAGDAHSLAGREPAGVL
jgi:hypothetical protein